MNMTQVSRVNPRVYFEYLPSILDDKIHIFIQTERSKVFFKELSCKITDSLDVLDLFDERHNFTIPLNIHLQKKRQKFLVEKKEFLDVFGLSEKEIYCHERVGDYALAKLIARINFTSQNVYLIQKRPMACEVITDPIAEKIIEVALRLLHVDFEMVFPGESAPFFMVRKNSFNQVDIAFVRDRLEQGNYGIVYKTYLFGLESTDVFAAKIALNRKKEANIKEEVRNLLKVHQVAGLPAVQDLPLASIRSEGRVVGFLGTYYKGGDLFNSIARGCFLASGNISLLKALELTISLIETLELLQKNKYILTDIKLENIFLKEDGNVVFGDLGSIFNLTEDVEVDFRCSFSHNILHGDYQKLLELLININNKTLAKEVLISNLRSFGKLLQKMQVFQMGIVLFSLCQGIEEESYPFILGKNYLLKKTEEEFLFSSLIPVELQGIICRMLAEEGSYELSAVLEDLKSLSKRAKITFTVEAGIGI